MAVHIEHNPGVQHTLEALKIRLRSGHHIDATVPNLEEPSDSEASKETKASSHVTIHIHPMGVDHVASASLKEYPTGDASEDIPLPDVKGSRAAPSEIKHVMQTWQGHSSINKILLSGLGLLNALTEADYNDFNSSSEFKRFLELEKIALAEGEIKADKESIEQEKIDAAIQFGVACVTTIIAGAISYWGALLQFTKAMETGVDAAKFARQGAVLTGIAQGVANMVKEFVNMIDMLVGPKLYKELKKIESKYYAQLQQWLQMALDDIKKGVDDSRDRQRQAIQKVMEIATDYHQSYLKFMA